MAITFLGIRFGVVALFCLLAVTGVARFGVAPPRFGVAARRLGVARLGVLPPFLRGVVSRISMGGFLRPRAGVPAARERAKNSRIFFGDFAADFGFGDFRLAFFFMRRFSRVLPALPRPDEEAAPVGETGSGTYGNLIKIRRTFQLARFQTSK